MCLEPCFALLTQTMMKLFKIHTSFTQKDDITVTHDDQYVNCRTLRRAGMSGSQWMEDTHRNKPRSLCVEVRSTV